MQALRHRHPSRQRLSDAHEPQPAVGGRDSAVVVEVEVSVDEGDGEATVEEAVG